LNSVLWGTGSQCVFRLRVAGTLYILFAAADVDDDDGDDYDYDDGGDDGDDGDDGGDDGDDGDDGGDDDGDGDDYDDGDDDRYDDDDVDADSGLHTERSEWERTTEHSSNSARLSTVVGLVTFFDLTG